MTRWVEKNSEAWELYQETLETEGRTFSEVIEERGLVSGEFPRAERLGLDDGPGQVRLSGGDDAPHAGIETVEHDRGLGSGGQPLWAILWSVPRAEWIDAPRIAAGLLYDDQNFDRVFPVNRVTAEYISRLDLGRELPSEEDLLRMCEEGARLGQDWGPPMS